MLRGGPGSANPLPEVTLAAADQPRRSHCGSLTRRATVQRQKKVTPPHGKTVTAVSCCNHVASLPPS